MDIKQKERKQSKQLFWANGLVVWFSFRVREVAGSIPAWPQTVFEWVFFFSSFFFVFVWFSFQGNNQQNERRKKNQKSNSESGFRSLDLWVMSPTRCRCANSLGLICLATRHYKTNEEKRVSGEKNKRTRNLFFLVMTGIEPATGGLLDHCSTDWATRPFELDFLFFCFVFVRMKLLLNCFSILKTVSPWKNSKGKIGKTKERKKKEEKQKGKWKLVRKKKKHSPDRIRTCNPTHYPIWTIWKSFSWFVCSQNSNGHKHVQKKWHLTPVIKPKEVLNTSRIADSKIMSELNHVCLKQT